MPASIVDLTADFSIVAYAIAWWLSIHATDSVRLFRSNLAYAIGGVGIVIHIVAAYGFSHRWSHQEALQHVASETQEIFGFAFPAGIYANFLFAVVYIGDSIWRFVTGGPQYRLPRSLAVATDIFLASIVIAATVVFESGPIRAIALALIIALLAKRFFMKPSH